MNTSDVLNTAADLIEQRGWTTGKGWNQGGSGPLCLEGAIGAAMGEGYGAGACGLFECPAADAVRDYLGRPVLFAWNDSLPHGWMQDDRDERGWVGGSKEAAKEYGRARVIEVLRAVAVIEAARERQPAEVSA